MQEVSEIKEHIKTRIEALSDAIMNEIEEDADKPNDIRADYITRLSARRSELQLLLYYIDA